MSIYPRFDERGISTAKPRVKGSDRDPFKGPGIGSGLSFSATKRPLAGTPADVNASVAMVGGAGAIVGTGLQFGPGVKGTTLSFGMSVGSGRGVGIGVDIGLNGQWEATILGGVGYAREVDVSFGFTK